MVANCDASYPRLRRMLIAVSALVVGFALSATAQTSTTSDNSASDTNFSSSNIQALLSPDAFLGGTPAASPKPYAVASPQYGNRQRYPQYPGYESKASHFAFVGGAGFTAPIGNATHGYETWGYNFDVGGGWNFTKKVGALFEYQFDKNKIPGTTIAAVGAQGGNINTHLFLFNGIYYAASGKKSGAYITGGGGFSRKVTNFTDLQQGSICYFFCYYVTQPVTVYNFSSFQGAADLGLGFYWKAFGQDSNGKLFVEARYVFVDSPKATRTSDGEGTEEIIPVTVGIRF